MSKRGQSEGTIYRRKTDGRWVAAISIGHGVGGRGRKYFYAKTRAEANKQLKDAQRAQDEGRPQPQGRETTEHFLREWLEFIKSSVRRRTYIRYEQAPQGPRLSGHRCGPIEPAGPGMIFNVSMLTVLNQDRRRKRYEICTTYCTAPSGKRPSGARPPATLLIW